MKTIQQILVLTVTLSLPLLFAAADEPASNAAPAEANLSVSPTVQPLATSEAPASRSRPAAVQTAAPTSVSAPYGRMRPDLSRRDELARSVTIIPSASTSLNTRDSLMLDLITMLKILDKKLAVAGDVVRWNSLYEFSDLGAERNSSPARALYVQGYGVIFVLRVGFPLTPPEQITAEPVETGADPVWEKARRQYGREAGRSAGPMEFLTFDTIARPENTDAVPYDAEQVEAFKTQLIELMRHTANISRLGADEHVIFSVTGANPAVVLTRRSGKDADVAMMGPAQVGIVLSYPSRPRPSAVWTLRAKKSDIDAFAKGTMTLEQFGQKVTFIVTQPES